MTKLCPSFDFVPRLVSRGQTTNFLQGVIACSISAHFTGAYTASGNTLWYMATQDYSYPKIKGINLQMHKSSIIQLAIHQFQFIEHYKTLSPCHCMSAYRYLQLCSQLLVCEYGCMHTRQDKMLPVAANTTRMISYPTPSYNLQLHNNKIITLLKQSKNFCAIRG